VLHGDFVNAPLGRLRGEGFSAGAGIQCGAVLAVRSEEKCRQEMEGGGPEEQ